MVNDKYWQILAETLILLRHVSRGAEWVGPFFITHLFFYLIWFYTVKR